MFPVTYFLMFCILQLLCECFSYCCSVNCVPTWLNCTEITIVWLQLYISMTELFSVLSLNNLKKLFFWSCCHFCLCDFLQAISVCHLYWITLCLLKTVIGGAECDCYTARWKFGHMPFMNQLGKRFRVYFVLIIASLFSFLPSPNLIFVCVCVCVCVYIYIYIYTHTHTHTHIHTG